MRAGSSIANRGAVDRPGGRRGARPWPAPAPDRGPSPACRALSCPRQNRVLACSTVTPGMPSPCVGHRQRPRSRRSTRRRPRSAAGRAVAAARSRSGSPAARPIASPSPRTASPGCAVTRSRGSASSAATSAVTSTALRGRRRPRPRGPRRAGRRPARTSRATSASRSANASASRAVPGQVGGVAAERRQRRPQLVRRVGQEAPLGVARPLQRRQHLVQRDGQLLHLVLAAGRRQPPRRVGGAADLGGVGGQALQRAQHAAGDGQRPAARPPRPRPGRRTASAGAAGRSVPSTWSVVDATTTAPPAAGPPPTSASGAA